MTPTPHLPTLKNMEVTLSPDLQARLDRISEETGRSRDAFIADALAGYLDDLQPIRETLDSRYDDIKEGRVKLIPGEEVVARLKAKSAALRAARS